MAWRLDESVIHGEVDNRKKGIVRGKLWLDGIAEPVVLELSGNACEDLTGCLLKFKNPKPTVPMRRDALFAPVQRGKIGDLTASQKVRVFDIPVKEAYMMAKRGEKAPEHMNEVMSWEDWLKGRRARRETGNKVAPEIIRRPSSSSDRRLRWQRRGDRNVMCSCVGMENYSS